VKTWLIFKTATIIVKICRIKIDNLNADKLVDMWQRSPIEDKAVGVARGINDEQVAGPPIRKTANFFKQLWLFFARSFVQQSRELPTFYLDNILVFISGSMLGFAYQNSKYVGPVPSNEIDACPML
jgi:hypothetical protein